MKSSKRIIQMSFDLEIPSDINHDELESLYNTIEEQINNFYDVDGKAQDIKSVGVFSTEDVTEQYKTDLGWKAGK